MATASKIKDLTGPGHTDRFGIGGTDLGVTSMAPDGRLVSVFGDTFERVGVGGPGWRSPVVLFGDPATLRTGIEWTGAAGPGGYAHQVLDYEHNSIIDGRRVTTMLPTDVITIGNQMYLHVMVCEGLGNVHWTALHRSTDDGQTWRPTGVTWPGGRHGGLFQVLTWGYGDGAWGWGNPPTVALTGAYGELCLRRVEDRWLLAFFNAGRYRIDVLSLDSPTANLYDAPRETLVQGTSWDAENHAQGAWWLNPTGATSCLAQRSTTCTSSSASGTPPPTGHTGPCSSTRTSPALPSLLGVVLGIEHLHCAGFEGELDDVARENPNAAHVNSRFHGLTSC